MQIIAVADVHSPRFMDGFVRSLRAQSPPDLFLVAGDMIDHGSAEEFLRIIDVIHNYLGTGFPIVACFGNEEYSEVRAEIIRLVGDHVTFLDERSVTICIDGLTVGIVGTQGALDRPTEWQKRHQPNVRDLFIRRAERAASLLRELRPITDRRILLMHYSPCHETCYGEERRYFAWLCSRRFYEVVIREKPDLVIHGHVHNSRVHRTTVGRSIVTNVAFPATGQLTTLELV